MNEKTPTQPERELKTSNINNIKRKIHPNRLLKILIFVIVNIFLIALFGAIIINYNQSSSTSEQALYEDNQLPKLAAPIPNETASLPDIYYPYSQFPELNSNTNLNNYTDSVLGISFKYPAKYQQMSIKALDSENDWENNGFVFFLSENDNDKEELIQYVIDCETEVPPAGLCREYILDDIEVSMRNFSSKNEYEDELFYYMEECEASSVCETLTVDEDKTIISEQAQASIDPRDIGMNYKIFFSGETPSFISAWTRKPIEFSDIIKTIIDTAELN